MANQDFYAFESQSDIPLAFSIGNVAKKHIPTYDKWIEQILKEWTGQLEHKWKGRKNPQTRANPALNKVKKFMDSGLSKKSFRAIQTLLLYAEEYMERKLYEGTTFKEASLEIKKVKIRNAGYVIKEEKVALTVPNLSQSVLSIIPGTELTFKAFETIYEDAVDEVENDTLYLEDTNGQLKREYSKNTVSISCEDITFFPSKVNYIRMHRAIWNIDEFTIDRLLPETISTEIPEKENIQYQDLEYSNNLIGANEEQCQAIQHILQKTSYPFPYILFGPPGTGKTKTLTEVIFQIWKNDSKSRIIVATPSNAAADVLALELKKYISQKNSIVRLMSQTSDSHPKLEDIVRYCARLKTTDPRYPKKISRQELSKFSVVVVTLQLSAILACDEVKKFSHVFIDEASQATISDTLLPIVRVLNKKGHITLVGDPRQLGPVVNSPVACKYGMETSLLEQLTDSCPLYQENEDEMRNPQFITILLKNFRSHPDLIKLPSELFYGGKLVSAVDGVSNLCTLPILPNKEFPILFHGVSSVHEKSEDPNITSLFNQREIEHVLSCIKLLQQYGVPTSSIGVLSPYKLQVTKIKEEIKKAGIKDILVGSTEQFQGGERDIMIISTVRSLASNNMGFLGEVKRFNVAITRAKSLMILIGDPDLLSMGVKTWRNLIEYVTENKNFMKCKLQYSIENHQLRSENKGRMEKKRKKGKKGKKKKGQAQQSSLTTFCK